ncbi:hypothetical protein K438DRAFT_2023170 [Mycena galopus ATCC 62051]|nr:hypothetical protein K438DRAFT_2023170 [Mycena galopus ATCC 62051]
MPNARLHGIADAHRFEAPTFMDWLEGERQSVLSQYAQQHPSGPGQRLVFEHPFSAVVNPRGRLGTRAALPDTEYRFSSAPFPQPSFLLALPTVLFRPRGVYADVVLNHPVPLVSPPPVRPSLLTTPPERRLNDAAWMRSMTTKPLLACFDAPHPTPRTYATSPRTPYHAHALCTPAHSRYDTQAAGAALPPHTPPSLTPWAQRPPAAFIPHAMRHFPRLFLGADPTFVLDVINAKASAGTRARSNATDETIDSGSTSVQAPRTKTGSGAVSTLAPVKDLKHIDNGSRVSQAQD